MGAGRLHAHNTLLCLSATSREIDERLNWKGFMVDNLYPNPAIEEVTFAGSFANRGELIIRLMDTQGREVATVYDGMVTEGLFAYDWVIDAELEAGLYFASWEFEGVKKGQRLMIVR